MFDQKESERVSMHKRQATPKATTIDVSKLQLLAVPDVAKLLSVGRTTIYALIAAGVLQTVKIGTARRVLAVSVWQYLERQRQN